MAHTKRTGEYLRIRDNAKSHPFIMEQLKMNGKEAPKASLERYTGHMFLKQLRANNENLDDYIFYAGRPQLFILQRDQLAIQLLIEKWP